MYFQSKNLTVKICSFWEAVTVALYVVRPQFYWRRGCLATLVFILLVHWGLARLSMDWTYTLFVAPGNGSEISEADVLNADRVIRTGAHEGAMLM